MKNKMPSVDEWLREAKAEGVKKARVHVLLDGRDVPATSAPEYVKALEDCKTKTPGIFVAGDCRTKSVRQLATAAADGAIAGIAASQYV